MVSPVFEASIFQALIGLRPINETINLAGARAATGLRVNGAGDDAPTFIRGIRISNAESVLTSRANAAKTALIPISAAIKTLENVLTTLGTVRTNLEDTLASGDYAAGGSVHASLRRSFVGVIAGANLDGTDLLTAGSRAELVLAGGPDIAVVGTDFTAIATNAGGDFTTTLATATDARREVRKADADITSIQVFLGTLSAARAAITAVQNADTSSALQAAELRTQLLSANIELEGATLRAANTQRDVARNTIGILSSSQRSILAIFNSS